ncbi:hypothetical protein ES703_21029 [subsurface metagenome]
MKRREFTHMVELLLHQASLLRPYEPIIDYCKRSAQEQNRLYKKGLSKLDGYKKKSQHQFGKAIDIYLVRKGKISWAKWRYEVLHDYWVKIGGKPMISWDIAHFEV